MTTTRVDSPFRPGAILALGLLLSCLLADTASAAPFDDYPNRLTVHIENPELAAMTGLASVRVNFGPLASPDGADLIVLDAHGREQPSLIRSITPDGEIELGFHVKSDPTGDYQVLFGKAQAARPAYDVPFRLGRVISDDALPAQSRNHGLWEWAPTPRLSGTFSHTTPVTGAMTYHGSTGFTGIVPTRGQILNQYVYLDPDNPPTQLLLRVVFQGNVRSNPWDLRLVRVDCNWGGSSLKPEPVSGNWNVMGELPAAGRWVRLSMDLSQLLGRAEFPGYDRSGDNLPAIYGIEFYTDKGRAFWDMTTLDEVPANALPVSLKLPAGAPPAFVYHTVRSFRLRGADQASTLVRFLPSTPAGTALTWDFGDGGASNQRTPLHLFTGVTTATVTLKQTDAPNVAPVSRKLIGLDPPLRPTQFALDVVSCPVVVSARDDVLFNLALEGTSEQALDAELVVIDRDADNAELARFKRPVTILPGPGHPINVTFTRKLSDPKLHHLDLELVFHSRTLTSATINVYDSAGSLEGIRLVGDACLDRDNHCAVIRYSAARTSLNVERKAAPVRVLLLGELPTAGDTFDKRLERTLGLGEVTVGTWSSTPFPAWSLPWRQVLSLNELNTRLTGPDKPDVILVAPADRLLLAGVSSADAVNVTGVLLEQLRLRTDARLILVTPIPYTGFERQARDYAVGLKELALARSLPVADFYSRALRTARDVPGTYNTLSIENAVSRHRIPEELLPILLDTLLTELSTSPTR